MITKPVTAHELGRTLAQVLCGNPLVEEIWVDEFRGDLEVWVLTTAFDDSDDDDDQATRLYQARGPLYQAFPGLRLTYHVINPDEWEPGTRVVGQVIRPTAQRIELACS